MAREGRALSLPGSRLRSEILHKCVHFNSHFTCRQDRKYEFINAYPRYCREYQYMALDTAPHVSLGAGTGCSYGWDKRIVLGCAKRGLDGHWEKFLHRKGD